MSLMVRDVCSIMEKFAPKILSESYDNVGLMVGNLEENVSSILVALDCTLEVIEEAKEKNCNFILTHHPLLFHKPSSITSETLVGKKIIQLIKNDICLYSSHTNLDSVSGGVNDALTKLLGYKKFRVLETTHVKEFQSSNAGIGRIVKLEKEQTLESILLKVKDRLKIKNLRYVGDESMPINTIAIVNGSGSDYLEVCQKQGVDCVVTGDITYHYASDYNESRMAIIDAGHFATEWLPLVEVSNRIGLEISKLGHKNDILISQSTQNPYKYKTK